MTIKDRLTKKTTAKTTQPKKKSRIKSGIEVLDFFEVNKNVSGMFIYDNNKIYLENNGDVKFCDEEFDFSISDLVRVIAEKYQNNFISVGDSYIVETENGTIINIVSKPYLKSGSFISFQKKRQYDFSIESFFKHQTLNYDVSDYLSKKLSNGENIFVVGAVSADKLPVLSYLSGLINENVSLIQGTECILTNASNVLEFSKYSLPFKELVSKGFSLNHSLIVSKCDEISELMSVFEFINLGFKHFVVSFNVNSHDEFAENLKNTVMINYPQMSEEKIIAMIASAVKNVVFLEKMKDGETRVSHVSEIKFVEGKLKTEDIFVFDFAKFDFINKKELQEHNIKKEEKTEVISEKSSEPIKRVSRKKIKRAESNKVKNVVIRKRKIVKNEVSKEEIPSVVEVKQIEPVVENQTVEPSKQEDIIILEENPPYTLEPVEEKQGEEIEENFEEEISHEITIPDEPAFEAGEVQTPVETEKIEEPKVQEVQVVAQTEVKEETSQSLPASENIPLPVVEPMKQLSQKVNKYKLLKEKLRKKREQEEG